MHTDPIIRKAVTPKGMAARLFTPRYCRRVAARNRGIISPMQQSSALDGVVTNRWCLIHPVRFAQSGVRGVFVGSMAAQRCGCNTYGDHGYLLHQYLLFQVNRRDDICGGDAECCRRLSLTNLGADEQTREELLTLCTELRARGVDLIASSSGGDITNQVDLVAIGCETLYHPSGTSCAERVRGLDDRMVHWPCPCRMWVSRLISGACWRVSAKEI